MRRLELAQQGKAFLVVQGIIGAVAHKFGIGLLAKHHDGHIRLGRKAAIGR